MKNQQLSFSYNWNNKLECKAFTTIRLKSDKYKVGTRLDVYLKEKFLYTVTVINRIDVLITEINEYMSRLDTGYSMAETSTILMRMYKSVDWRNQKLSFILLLRDKTETIDQSRKEEDNRSISDMYDQLGRPS